MTKLYAPGTEYLANEIKFKRGAIADITSVGVYHNVDPNVVPTPAQFTTDVSANVQLVDGTEDPTPALGESGKIDVLSLQGADGIILAAGDHQRWVLVTTATETIIRPIDTVTVVDTI